MDGLLSHFVTALFSIFATVCGGLVLNHLRSKPRLELAFPPAGQVHLGSNWYSFSSVAVANRGAEAATNVEVMLASRPEVISANPPRPCTERVDANGTFHIGIGSLGPRETIWLHAFSPNDHNIGVINCRSDNAGGAKWRQVVFQRQAPTWVISSMGILALLGAITAITILAIALTTMAQSLGWTAAS